MHQSEKNDLNLKFEFEQPDRLPRDRGRREVGTMTSEVKPRSAEVTTSRSAVGRLLALAVSALLVRQCWAESVVQETTRRKGRTHKSELGTFGFLEFFNNKKLV